MVDMRYELDSARIEVQLLETQRAALKLRDEIGDLSAKLAAKKQSRALKRGRGTTPPQSIAPSHGRGIAVRSGYGLLMREDRFSERLQGQAPAADDATAEVVPRNIALLTDTRVQGAKEEDIAGEEALREMSLLAHFKEQEGGENGAGAGVVLRDDALLRETKEQEREENKVSMPDMETVKIKKEE